MMNCDGVPRDAKRKEMEGRGTSQVARDGKEKSEMATVSSAEVAKCRCQEADQQTKIPFVQNPKPKTQISKGQKAYERRQSEDIRAVKKPRPNGRDLRWRTFAHVRPLSCLQACMVPCDPISSSLQRF